MQAAQLPLLPDIPPTPARRSPPGARRATKLTFEFDPSEWDDVIFVATRTGKTVAEVAEAALSEGLRLAKAAL